MAQHLARRLLPSLASRPQWAPTWWPTTHNWWVRRCSTLWQWWPCLPFPLALWSWPESLQEDYQVAVRDVPRPGRTTGLRPEQRSPKKGPQSCWTPRWSTQYIKHNEWEHSCNKLQTSFNSSLPRCPETFILKSGYVGLLVVNVHVECVTIYTVGRCEISDHHLPPGVADNGEVVILTNPLHIRYHMSVLWRCTDWCGFTNTRPRTGEATLGFDSCDSVGS